MIARGGEARSGPKHLRALAERRKRRLRFTDKRRQMAPGARSSQSAYKSRLVAPSVFTGFFAKPRGVALRIQNIVRNLEGGSKRGSVSNERRAVSSRRFCIYSSGFDTVTQQCARLHALHSENLGWRKGSASAFSFQIERLPSRHAARPGSTREAQNKLRSHFGVFMRRLIGHHVESERQKAVACKNGCRFVKSLVDGRASAPQIIIIHSRQIIVDERVAMHHFNRAGAAQHPLVRNAEQKSGLQGKKGPKALAAAKAGVLHRAQQLLRAFDFSSEGTGAQQRLHLRAH